MSVLQTFTIRVSRVGSKNLKDFSDTFEKYTSYQACTKSESLDNRSREIRHVLLIVSCILSNKAYGSQNLDDQKFLALCRVIHPDQMEQNRLFKHALVQLNNSITDMESAQHVQLLCDSYKNAQRKLWEGNDDVKVCFIIMSP